MTELRLDLTQIPFSRAGSYLALSLRDPDEARPWEQRPGSALYLRTLHGDRGTDRVFRLEPITPAGDILPFHVEAEPHRIRFWCDEGRQIDLCLTRGSDALRLQGRGDIGLRLTLVRLGTYGNAQPYDREERHWLVNAWAARMTYLLTALQGRLVVDAPAGILNAERVVADFLPESETGGFEGLVEEWLPERTVASPPLCFEEETQAARSEFAGFLEAQPPVPETLQETVVRMAYVQWASLIAPAGYLGRPAMLMSKNHMTSVWSWDHCFNALALMPHAPALAWDQFLLPFDHQDAAGALPDSVNDKSIVRSFTKPPIHGWTLRGLRERDSQGYLTDERLAAIYEPLARWTRWWLVYRDQDGDGIPQYNHGNDSGWDNSTAFDIGFPLESPDLTAYLILQMDALADLARRLCRSSEEAEWKSASDALLARMIAHFWQGDRFVALRSGSRASVPIESGDSLLPFLPLVLGERLPSDIRETLVRGLLMPGRFLTEFGLATEAVTSPQHEPDGYWRGPIWAPPILLIADGLRRMGEESAAREIATRFCRVVSKSGAAENFDARTGAGRRDRAYTWTASVFLILAREFLDPAAFILGHSLPKEDIDYP